MAVVWSWAFGAETLAVLEDMGFASPTAGGTQAATSTAADTYTYGAFPGTKYSWSTSAFRAIRTTGAGWTATGTVAVAVKANTAWYSNVATPLIKMHTGSGRSINVYCTNTGTGTISLYVDSVLAGTTTLTVNDWHYLALKYDVSTVNWTAELWVNNPASATISGTSTDVAETSGFYESGGFAASPNLALLAQLIVYDSATAIGTAKVPYFVSRIAPTADTGEVGTWAPSTGATNFGVTAGTFVDTTYTREASPSISDNVVTQTPALNVALGLASGSLLGATNHTWSSGTAIQCKAYVRDSTGSFSSGGATVTPDAADPTYAFDTQTAGLTSAGVIELKYQIV